MKGYLGNPDATAAPSIATAGSTPATSATSTRRADFFIVDRVKELIKYKGFQVAPAELEALLLTPSRHRRRGGDPARRRGSRRGAEGLRRARARAPRPTRSPRSWRAASPRTSGCAPSRPSTPSRAPRAARSCAGCSPTASASGRAALAGPGYAARVWRRGPRVELQQPLQALQRDGAEVRAGVARGTRRGRPRSCARPGTGGRSSSTSHASASPRMRAPCGIAAPGQPVGVAAPVHALVVVADPRDLLGQQHVVHHPRAEGGVLLDLLVLRRGRAGRA